MCADGGRDKLGRKKEDQPRPAPKPEPQPRK